MFDHLATMLTQWRRLGFFDKEPVKGLEEFESVSVTTATSGRGQTILGDADGWIAICDRTMYVHKFRGFDIKVNHLLALSVHFCFSCRVISVLIICSEQQHSYLIGVGEDSSPKSSDGQNPVGSSVPFVKIWDLEQPTTDGGYVVLCRHELYQGLHLNKVMNSSFYDEMAREGIFISSKIST